VWNFLVTGFKKNYSSDEQKPILCAAMDGSPFMMDLQDASVKEPAVMAG